MSQENVAKIQDILNRAKQFIFGQDDLLENILAGLVCQGHILIEGLPGLGKTMSVSVMSQLCQLKFQRIQFTPDLLPSDLVGTMMYNQGKQEFSTKFGPIFTQILLADEINRSPAKVQSALLEAMAERQVTIGEQTHKLQEPFVVLATQNPIEQEGTYPLPEAQLDRFMVKTVVKYPQFQSELSILSMGTNSTKELVPILSTSEIIKIKNEVEKIYVDDKIKEFIIRLVHSTRPGTDYFPAEFKDFIKCGASPRGAIWLQKLAKWKAYLSGMDYCLPEHVQQIAYSVLSHRVSLTYEAEVEGMHFQQILKRLLERTL